MPVVWRLAAPAYADFLNGEGSRIFGARWNSPGRGVVYTCAHLSLSVLETYVHIPPEQRDALPEFEALCIQVPDNAGMTRITPAMLEGFLLASDPESACRAVGDRWLEAGADLVLAAPSIVVPEELNFMLNPVHSRMHEVSIVSRRKFDFDPRLATTRLERPAP
jgi:RES domain-containing protein